MARQRLRWLVAGTLASGGAGLLTLTAMMNSAFAFGASGTALIMGGTGNPTPDPTYVTDVNENYIQLIPSTEGYTPVPQFTPEQFFPVTPNLGNLTFDQSVAMGVTDLDAGITQALGTGNPVAVFGYSQSATVATDEMNKLALANNPIDPMKLAFVLVGDPNNPDGGILERFVGAYIPILDVSFNGATPPDTPYPTDIYTIQYDGIADAPQYPTNLLADANAIAGYFDLHKLYPTLPVTDFNVTLPTSPGYEGATHYFEMLTQNLPLLDSLRQFPVVGNPLADLIQPDLRVLVDLGYGDGYANVPTPADFFGPLVNPITVGGELATGAQQGATAAMIDLGLLPTTDLPTVYPYVPLPETPGEIATPSLLAALSDPSATTIPALQNDLADLLGSSTLSSALSGDLVNLLDGQWTALLSGFDLPTSLMALLG